MLLSESNMLNEQKILKFAFPGLLILSGIVIWFGALNIPFLNDDFQIVGWHNPENFIDCFRPFWQTDVSGFYWRPLVNITHSLTLYFFGFEAFYFHLFNFIVYISVVIAAGYLMLEVGIDHLAAFAASIIFLAAPVHELFLGWIAVRGDTMAALFLILHTIFLIKYINNKSVIFIIVSMLTFLAALLSKELSFMGLFIPFILLTVIKRNNYALKDAFWYSALSMGLIILVIVLRQIIIGGSLLESDNLNNISVISMAKNLLVYIPLSFFTPETLEKYIYYIANNYLLMFLLALIASIFIFSILKQLKTISKPRKNLFWFGLLWFVIFIIPALPLLMRWYMFAASFGLFIAFASVLEFRSKQISYFINGSLVILALLLLSGQNMDQMEKWVAAGKKVTDVVSNMKEMKNPDRTMLRIFCVPDKFDRINAMKIGLQQTFQYATSNMAIDIRSPLRIECSPKTKISIKKISNNYYKFSADSSRFLLQGGKSTSLFKDEEWTDYRDSTKIEIINTGGYYPRAEAYIKVDPVNVYTKDYWFDGDKFIVLN